MTFNADVRGLPRDLEVSIDDFHEVAAVIETTGAQILEGKLLGIDGGFLQLVDEYDTETAIGTDEVLSFQFEAMEWTDAHTSVVPVAWVNRLVSAKVTHGEVFGLLSDDNFGETEHLYLQALPGHPAVPPLPMSVVHGVALVPRAFHASVHPSPDGRHQVNRYFTQDHESVFVRELHVNFEGVSADDRDLVIDDDPDSDFLPVLPDMYQMKYRRALGGGGIFYRCPAPVSADGVTAMHNNAYRMRWAPPGVHLTAEPPCQYHVSLADGSSQLTEDILDRKPSDAPQDESSDGSVE